MELVFTDELRTKNELIDTQHEELINRIAAFVQSCESGEQNKVKAIKMMDYMAEYTEFHFGEEEKLMESVSYPELSKHQEKHQEFIKTVAALENMLEESEGPTDAFVEKVKEKVVDWILYHIKTFDRSVAEYIMMQDNPQYYN